MFYVFLHWDSQIPASLGLLIYIAMFFFCFFLFFFLAMHVMALIHSFHVMSELQSHYEGFWTPVNHSESNYASGENLESSEEWLAHR